MVSELARLGYRIEAGAVWKIWHQAGIDPWVGTVRRERNDRMLIAGESA